MSSHDPIASLVTALMAATRFEDAATTTLRTMLTCVEGPADRFSAGRRLLRGVVHLRPHDGYQRLFGLEHGSGARVEGTGYVTSANVWRWVVEHRCSVSIDVPRATIRPWLKDGPIERREPDPSSGLPGDASREHMLGRDATDVHVVPLRAPGGDVIGMITFEASHRAAVRRDTPWDDCHDELELLASVAAPYLAALPVRPTAAAHTDDLLPVIGQATASVIELMRVFARQEETILISGPTGSGKSRLARWCHARSGRAEHRFETVDLLSVPEELQMAELFGWKRGAFTGAVKDMQGAIARTGQGTLFIDEVDKLSFKAQAGLLRVLEERRYRPIGDDLNEQRAAARFLVGTNADLRAAVRAGRFREDLYFRINVLPVRMLPLAERLDELPLWAEYMLSRRHSEGGEGAARLAPEATSLMMATPWPGNLRQLDNIIRRAYALALSDRAPGGLVLERRHVERALAYDETDPQDSLVTSLWRAAQAFVREAERRSSTGAPLSLEQCDVLRGMVLAAAVRLRGNRDDAFLLLGQQQLLKSRNHHRALRREVERVRELLRAAGTEADRDLAAVLDEVDSSADR